ncbi:unnamed protein product [Thlaspi arvense]|uniref:RING-type domain-containing protein n=1 Tax=Thlaspi arvense TaxID=13288 RepID=A0AAU9RZ08_THLAR|nr:unnamed protein product [Thlaspi arvense]
MNGQIKPEIIVMMVFVVFFALLGCIIKCCEGFHHVYGRSDDEHGVIIITIEKLVGVNPSVLRSISVVDFNSQDFKDGVECVVCLSELADGDRARVLPSCNHWFHADCIDSWFQSHFTCPICRKIVGSAQQLVLPKITIEPSDFLTNPPPNTGTAMDDDLKVLFELAIVLALYCGALWCLCRLESYLRNYNLPTQPPRSFHDLIKNIEPSGNYKPPAPRPIPVVTFNSRHFKDGIQCVVCLSELAEGDKARVLPSCNHCFHADCIDQWLQSNSSCPVCRNNNIGRLILSNGEVVIDILGGT